MHGLLVSDRFDQALGPGRGRAGERPSSELLICVLGDASTYGALHGCTVVALPDDFDDESGLAWATDVHVVCDLVARAPFANLPEVPPPGTWYALVLNDGETFSALAGCTVADLREPGYDGERVLEASVTLRTFA